MRGAGQLCEMTTNRSGTATHAARRRDFTVAMPWATRLTNSKGCTTARLATFGIPWKIRDRRNTFPELGTANAPAVQRVSPSARALTPLPMGLRNSHTASPAKPAAMTSWKICVAGTHVDVEGSAHGCADDEREDRREQEGQQVAPWLGA